MIDRRKVAIINGVSYGSTYGICENIKQKLLDDGVEVFTFYGWTKNHRKSTSNDEMVGSFWSRLFHLLVFKLTKMEGGLSSIDTKRLVKKLERFGPEVISIHLLHCQDINFRILFRYIKQNNIKVIWTFHDCWAFTGGCPHFDYVGCNQWNTECSKCLQTKKIYHSSFQKMFYRKKDIFTSINDLTIVTPSQWMANLVKLSFFNSFPVRVINNGIDRKRFKKNESRFSFPQEFSNKKIVLGVAFGWSFKKGIDVFVRLASDLDNEAYQIVLVGTDDKLKKQLPSSIYCINRTNNVDELISIYSSAYVFVNPTREDNYPTVLMEAISCETPVVCFDTGGCKEIVKKAGVGVCVKKDDYDALLNIILSNKLDNRKMVSESIFSRDIMVEEYKALMIGNRNDVFKKY